MLTICQERVIAKLNGFTWWTYFLGLPGRYRHSNHIPGKPAQIGLENWVGKCKETNHCAPHVLACVYVELWTVSTGHTFQSFLLFLLGVADSDTFDPKKIGCLTNSSSFESFCLVSFLVRYI